MSDFAEKKIRHVYRFPPCPSYDIEGTESWLGSMAEQGLFLVKDGFFAGFATFERGESRRMRYRLEAAPKPGDDAKAREAVELSRELGWEYIAFYGRYHIYRTESEHTVELNTDPRVQALALNSIRRNEWANVLVTLLWLGVFSFLYLRGSVLLSAIGIGSWLFLLGVLIVLWSVCSSVASLVYLCRLHRRLNAGRAPDHGKNWRRRSRRYRAGVLLFLVLAAVWGVGIVHAWSEDASDANVRQFTEVPADLPFPTIADLRPDGDFSLTDLGHSTNTVKTTSDWLAPVVIQLRENGAIRLPHGGQLNGGLQVDYYETAAPWIARELAREHQARDRSARHYSEIGLPDLGVDEAAAYDSLFPVVLLRQGNRVLRVQFYQTSESYTMPVAEWAQVFAEHLKAQGGV